MIEKSIKKPPIYKIKESQHVNKKGLRVIV
jgi:hypothetical protein